MSVLSATTEEHPSRTFTDNDPYIDTDEAAAIPRVHPQTIRKAYREGRLRGIKVNGARTLRFRRSWVIAWLEGGQ
jgi:excisionase family DNA binding protein